MQSALSSFNFLLRALSEKDDEISSLKKRMQNAHPFGSDRSLDGGGFATPTFAKQRSGRTATYNVEYLLYGNNDKMQNDGQPPKVLTPPYEFEPPQAAHSNLSSNSQPGAEVLGLKSI